jgi:hypothetical protein
MEPGMGSALNILELESVYFLEMAILTKSSPAKPVPIVQPQPASGKPTIDGITSGRRTADPVYKMQFCFTL